MCGAVPVVLIALHNITHVDYLAYLDVFLLECLILDN